MSDPTQTGWTFRDVDNSLNSIATKADNRRISGDTSRVEEVPIRELYATQPTVNPDFATTSSSAGEMPLVVRKGGKMFVQDGHHRLTKQAEGGAQTAPVRFIDLDNADTSTPLLDWSPEKTGFVEADQDILDQLFSANASKSAGLLGSVASDVSQRGDDLVARVDAARKAMLDSPNDAGLFDEYKRLRRERDAAEIEAPAAQPSSGLLSDYVGDHQAPMRDGNAPAFDLAGDIYPDDIYSPKAVQYYGTGNQSMDKDTMGLLQSLRGKPDADVTIYRAVPKGVDQLNAGDWVTVNKQYARDHGEAALGGDFDIVEKKVKAKDIFTNGDSIHEFGYDPENEVSALKRGLLD